jgi:hypothetical protein
LKILLLSFLGGLLITIGLVAAGIAFDPPESWIKIVLWPVALLVKAAGDGPRLSSTPPQRYEWTAVHELAVAIGLGLSFTFYSALTAGIIAKVRRVRR